MLKEKVQEFHKQTYQKLRDRTSKCEAKLDPVATSIKSEDGEPEEQSGSDGNGNGNGKKPVPSDQEKQRILKEVLEELDNITKETNELEKYSRINYTGFLKIAKKHDRKRGGRVSVRSPLQSLLVRVPFNKEDYSPLLYRLSSMYSFVRQQLDGKQRPMSMAESFTGGEEYRSQKCKLHVPQLVHADTNESQFGYITIIFSKSRPSFFAVFQCLCTIPKPPRSRKQVNVTLLSPPSTLTTQTSVYTRAR